MRSVSDILLASALVLSAPLAAAQDHAHHRAVPVPEPARRHAGDAPLREHMAGIRQAVAALEHAEHGHLDPAQVAALADMIGGQVRRIVAECSLPPEADAALHLVLAPLAQGAGALKAAPRDLSPVGAMRQALSAYDGQFAD